MTAWSVRGTRLTRYQVLTPSLMSTSGLGSEICGNLLRYRTLSPGTTRLLIARAWANGEGERSVRPDREMARARSVGALSAVGSGGHVLGRAHDPQTTDG